MQAKELRIRVRWMRENPQDAEHGDVHIVVDVKFAPKRKVALCGADIVGMRSQSTPFNGWQEVTCKDCWERLEI